MRIAIVNDVALAVEAVRRVLVQAAQHELAWVAHDGAEAVAVCERDTPDLILMDLVMPRMDGVEATRRIMARNPCAIVVVTANVQDNCSKVFEAMGAGALDAVNTPVLECPGSNRGTAELLAKIEIIRKLVGAADSGSASALPALSNELAAPLRRLVVIGASAGGPAALASLLAALPADFPAPIVIVQHVDSHFAPGLAGWLQAQTPLRVRVARQGDRPQPGEVLLAGKADHLVFTTPNRFGYSRQPVDCSYRPSVDVFFKSVARLWQGEVVAVLLTGMGRDGAEGLRSLRAQSHRTIAQDQASSAVYGMPKAAAQLGAADEILALDEIGPRLNQLLSCEPPSRRRQGAILGERPHRHPSPHVGGYRAQTRS